MKKWIFLCALFLSHFANAQSSDTKTTTIGFEIKPWPYIAGDYDASAWIARKRLRYRLAVARFKMPEFLLPDDFSNNKIRTYALMADFFFRPNFKGFMLGTGLAYWRGQGQTYIAALGTSKYDNYVFTFGTGYVFKLPRNFYLYPWMGAHFQLAGDREVKVSIETFEPWPITPILSLKTGWHF